MLTAKDIFPRPRRWAMLSASQEAVSSALQRLYEIDYSPPSKIEHLFMELEKRETLEANK
jgi:hypothetical protein